MPVQLKLVRDGQQIEVEIPKDEAQMVNSELFRNISALRCDRVVLDEDVTDHIDVFVLNAKTVYVRVNQDEWRKFVKRQVERVVLSGGEQPIRVGVKNREGPFFFFGGGLKVFGFHGEGSVLNMIPYRSTWQACLILYW